jgi:hypothetical protein
MFFVGRSHRTQFIVGSPPNGACERLERVDFHTADDFFNTYEHLGDCGLGVWHWAGFEGDRLLGVVSFGTTVLCSFTWSPLCRFERIRPLGLPDLQRWNDSPRSIPTSTTSGPHGTGTHPPFTRYAPRSRPLRPKGSFAHRFTGLESPNRRTVLKLPWQR